MGSIGDCVDNSVAERFFATLQTELPDRSTGLTREAWPTPFTFIEGFYSPRRRHSTLGYLIPADYETQHRAGTDHDGSMITTTQPEPSGHPGALQAHGV